jgi:hypothetical protein
MAASAAVRNHDTRRWRRSNPGVETFSRLALRIEALERQAARMAPVRETPVTDAPDQSPQALSIDHDFQPNGLKQFFYVLAAKMLDHKNSICSFFRIPSKIFHVRLTQFFYLALCRWAYCQT